MLRECCQCIFETLLIFKIQLIILCVLEVKQAVNIFWEQVSNRQIRKKRSSFILLHCSCCGSLELICAAKVFLRLALIFYYFFLYVWYSVCSTTASKTFYWAKAVLAVPCCFQRQRDWWSVVRRLVAATCYASAMSQLYYVSRANGRREDGKAKF